MSAVRATFEDVKRVKTRKVWQLIFEVPEEAYDAAISTLGGSPQSGTDRWVGIAPITAPKATSKRPAEQTTEAPKLKGGQRTKRPWNDLSMPEQAGILVNDIAFAKWLLSTEYEAYSRTVVQDDATLKKEADAVLKSRCDIESKSALGVREDGSALNSFARGQFIRIEREWRDSQRGWDTQGASR